MTTGSRGLHVVAPIAGRDDVNDVLALARDLAHAVAPYAIRPLPKAPVATPLSWAELDDRTVSSAQAYTIRTVLDRDDPWADFPRGGPSVATIRRRLDRLTA